MNQSFQKLILLSFLLFIASGISSLYAQSDTGLVNNNIVENKYLIKINLLAIPISNFSFQFERAISKKMAIGLGLRYMPKSGLPLKSQIENLIDDPESWDQIKDLKTSNFAVTPEIRFYMGKSVFRGFYVAPFIRYTKYNAELPFTFNVPNGIGGGTTAELIPLSGNLTTFTGGVLIGAQWKLSKLLYLDWSILGPQYGTSNGNISGKRSLSTDEQDALREELQTLELPFVKTTYTVDNTGAKVDFNGPWAGIRSSLGIGIRF